MKSINAFEKQGTFTSPVFGEVAVAIDANDCPWFQAKVIIKELGLSRSVYRRLDDEDKCEIHAGGMGRSQIWVNEAGMYSLVLGSKKPEAREFKRWVTNEVLPSIRKHGGYVLNQENLPADQQEDLHKQIETLAEQVKAATAGKKKLAGYLEIEEDRNFALQDELRNLKSEMAEVVRKLAEKDPGYAESMRPKRRMLTLEELADLMHKQACEFKPISTPDPDPDPLVLDEGGFLIRRSEFLAARN